MTVGGIRRIGFGPSVCMSPWNPRTMIWQAFHPETVLDRCYMNESLPDPRLDALDLF